MPSARFSNTAPTPITAEPQLQLTPLMLAAEGGYTEIVADLLKSGADIQVRTRTGATPARRLPCVAASGCGSHGVGIVRGGLPDKGIRAPIPGNMTPLMYAAREGHIDDGAPAVWTPAPTSTKSTRTTSRRCSWRSATTTSTWRGS